MPALQQYSGKPAVRIDREDRGDVGIIESPLCATVPTCGGIRQLVSLPRPGKWYQDDVAQEREKWKGAFNASSHHWGNRFHRNKLVASVVARRSRRDFIRYR